MHRDAIRTRPGSVLVLLCAVVLAAGCAPGPSAQLPEEGAEILWDERGVPHIYAATDADLMRAFGWAQMEAHGDRILRLVALARGESAEHLGGENHVRNDRWVHTVGIPDRAERWYDAVPERSRRLIDAFVRGIDAWAAGHPDGLETASRRVLPLRPQDVLALIQYDIHFTFMASPALQGYLERNWEPGRVTGEQRTASSAMPPLPRPAAGSNTWAVAPSRSASGNALLLANPHLPWDGLFTWFEAHLVGPGVDAHGATLAGQPILGIAFNDRLGWSHTVNTIDAVDLYELVLEGEGYRWDGEVRAFDTEEETFRVRNDDGAISEEKVTVRRSAHGPVIASDGGHAVALRVAGLDQPDLVGQYWDMIRADDLASFEAALRRLQMPMFTVMYADRDGRIMHLFGGRVPDRPEGPWRWDGVVPGDTSATLWTETHAYGELPRVADPETGWLQNANDPPWTTTFPRALDPADYPSYMAPRRMAFRPQRSAELMMSDSSWTLEEVVRAKHSTRMLLADRLLDDLLPVARERGTDRARRAADVLEAWDREANADSRGAVLFRAFASELERRSDGSPFAAPWSPDHPLSTPDGLSDPGLAAEALDAAAGRVEERWDRLDPAWGDTRRYRRGDVDLPANGADGRWGVFRVVGYRAVDDGRYTAVGGDSYVAAVEFAPDGARARSLLGYGNGSREGFGHRGDQLEAMSRQELLPVWRTRAEVEAHLEGRQSIPPDVGR